MSSGRTNNVSKDSGLGPKVCGGNNFALRRSTFGLVYAKSSKLESRGTCCRLPDSPKKHISLAYPWDVEVSIGVDDLHPQHPQQIDMKSIASDHRRWGSLII